MRKVNLDDYKYEGLEPNATFYTKEEFIKELHDIAKKSNLPFGSKYLFHEWSKNYTPTKKLVPLPIYVEVIEEFFPEIPIFLQDPNQERGVLRQYSTNTGFMD